MLDVACARFMAKLSHVMKRDRGQSWLSYSLLTYAYLCHREGRTCTSKALVQEIAPHFVSRATAHRLLRTLIDLDLLTIDRAQIMPRPSYGVVLTPTGLEKYASFTASAAKALTGTGFVYAGESETAYPLRRKVATVITCFFVCWTSCDDSLMPPSIALNPIYTIYDDDDDDDEEGDLIPRDHAAKSGAHSAPAAVFQERFREAA